jgi:hypothetical protein
MAKQAVKLSTAQVARRHLAAREEARAQRTSRIQAIAIAIACAVGMFTLWTSASEREEQAFAAVDAAEAKDQSVGLAQRVIDLSTRSGRVIECIEAGLPNCR